MMKKQPRFEAKWYCRAPVRYGERYRLGFSGLCAPQFRLLANQPKNRINGRVVIAPVINEVDVSVGQLTVDEFQI